MVQQDIPQVAGRIMWEPQRIVDGFLALTENGLAEVDAETGKKLQEAAKEGGEGEILTEIETPDLLVWPEACLPDYLQLTESGETVGGPMIESILSYVTELRD